MTFLLLSTWLRRSNLSNRSPWLSYCIFNESHKVLHVCWQRREVSHSINIFLSVQSTKGSYSSFCQGLTGLTHSILCHYCLWTSSYFFTPLLPFLVVLGSLTFLAFIKKSDSPIIQKHSFSKLFSFLPHQVLYRANINQNKKDKLEFLVEGW